MKFPDIPTQERIDFPLSFSQESLWFLQQLEPGLTAYNRVYLFRLRGPLDVDVLEKSIDAILRRHAILRANFFSTGGNPIQRIGTYARRSLDVVDLGSLLEGERLAAAVGQAVEEANRPFAFDRESLCRTRLFRFALDDHILLINIHHILFDAWSRELFIKELGKFYQAFSQNATADLPELRLRYVDYVAWQRKWLTGENLERSQAYWREKLSGDLPILSLPTDHPRPQMQTYHGASKSVLLARRTSEALKAFFRSERSTASMGFLAAFQVLLCRYTGETDLIIGCPFANRLRPDLENLIGLFINTLPLRTDLSGDPTFRELLGRVRQTLLDAADHQSMPFERLLSELDIPRDLSRTPVYQVVFNMRNVPRHSFGVDNLSIEPLSFDDGKAPLDLSLEVTDTPDGFQLLLNYNCDLYEASTIDRMQRHFTTLLEGILNQPEARLSSLPILSAAEQHRILVEWNATDRPYPEGLGLHQIFEQKVAAHPGAIAVSMDTFQLTYAELNLRANRLAASLVGEGIVAGDIIAIGMERTPDLFVAVLGILKAGGAFLGLDLSLPPERLAFILVDSGAKMVLADSEATAKLDGLGSTRLIPWPTPSTGKASNPILPFGKIACVFYTSGSTGRPKGVLVKHQGVSRYLSGIPPYDFSPTDVIAQISEASSDLITNELWGALLNGARLEIVPQKVVFSPNALVERIEASGITVMLPPMGLVNLVARTDPGAFKNLRELSFGGEAADAGALRRIIEHGRPGILINGYGPTETTTDAMFYRVDQLDELATNIPIGRPLPNTKIYIVDQYLTPVPVGVAGEILIGGPGVAQGYINLPEQTAERFIPDRFSHQPDSCLFRTGDLGRYRPDGNIEFLGRLDDQVKVRGFRVEVQEIEAVLKQHAAIREAAVIYRDGPKGKELVAYCILNPGEQTTVDLRAYLKTRLPYYMLPSVFVAVERLPFTPNGKVDRRALSREVPPRQARVQVPPHDQVEAKLAEVWKRVLNVDSISIDDNFFELGGHSLLAVRLLAEIEAEFGCTFPLAALFEYGTVAEFARLISSNSSARISPLLIPMHPQGTKPPLFLMPGGGGDVFYLRELVNHLEEDRPVYGLQSIQPDLYRRGSLSVSEQAENYVREIRTFQPQGPYYLLGHSSGGILVFEIACRLVEAGETVGLLGMLDTYPPGMRPVASPDERLAIHWQNFLDAGSGKARANYLRARLQKLVVKSIKSTPFLIAAARARIVPEDRMTIAMLVHDSYRPRYYDGVLTMFRVQERLHYERNELILVWKRYARKVEVVNVPGNHHTLLHAPHVQELAHLLQSRLDLAD